MTPQEKIDVIRAQEQGKQIQFRVKPFIPISVYPETNAVHECMLKRHGTDWHDGYFSFDFTFADFRVKPEPREFWITEDMRAIPRSQYGFGNSHWIRAREVSS